MEHNTIITGVGGFYDVLTPENKIVRCKLRGRLRLADTGVLVGDWVTFTFCAENEGIIEEILPRKNQLARPVIANLDQAVIVMSLASPEMDFTLLDRMLVQIHAAAIVPIICVNKIDLSPQNKEAERRIDVYRNIGYSLVTTSVFQNTGFDLLQDLLRGKTSTFAGPSGVGKSSLLNRLVSGLNLPVGEVSAKLQRGRHTTRQAALICLPCGGLVADTPGFSRLTLGELPREEIQKYFPEIWAAAGQCRFAGCFHHREPGCAVIDQVSAGLIDPRRYANYVAFIEETNV